MVASTANCRRLAQVRPYQLETASRFVGLARYFRKCHPHIACITSRLSDLLKRNVRFDWTPLREQAFLDIKSGLASGPILIPPCYSKLFILAIYTSGTCIEDSLLQETNGCAIIHIVSYEIKCASVRVLNHRKR